MSQLPASNLPSYITSPEFLGTSTTGALPGVPAPAPAPNSSPAYLGTTPPGALPGLPTPNPSPITPQFTFRTPYFLIPTGFPVHPVSPGVYPISSTPPPFLAQSSYQAPCLLTPPPVSPVPPLAPPPPHSPIQWIVPSAQNLTPPESPESTPPQNSSPLPPPPSRSSPEIVFPETPSPESDHSDCSFAGCHCGSHDQTHPYHENPDCVDCRIEREQENAIRDQVTCGISQLILPNEQMVKNENLGEKL